MMECSLKGKVRWLMGLVLMPVRRLMSTLVNNYRAAFETLSIETSRQATLVS